MQPATKVPQNQKILVVDDNEIIQRTLQLALQERGYKVVATGGIADALTKVRHEKPDLILLDLEFPPDASSLSLGLHDGFWALGWMQYLKEVNGIPIIVISGTDSEKNKARALTAGAAGYFHKPINPDELATTIAGLLAKKSAAKPA